LQIEGGVGKRQAAIGLGDYEIVRKEFSEALKVAKGVGDRGFFSFS
jgi:hypothetical protein